MKRKIIKIDEERCNGCGACVPNCPEGALQVIDGKARLVGDLLCDGLGACIGRCPLGAILIEEREAEPYDERKVIGNIIPSGMAVIEAHLAHLRDHGQDDFLAVALTVLREKGIEVDFHTPQESGAPGTAPASTGCNGGHGHSRGGGCPGSRAMALGRSATGAEGQTSPPSSGSGRAVSELRNWPVQLRLLNPDAPYLKGADLLVAADCSAFAHPDFHGRFLKDRILVMFCPKLDQDLDGYVDKLAHIFQTKGIGSVTIVRMEVPCCGGIEAITKKAIEKSGARVFVKEYTLSLSGEII